MAMTTKTPAGKLLLALAAAALGSCATYNDQCTPVVSDPSTTVAILGGDLTIARADVRSTDQEIGRIMADSFLYGTADAAKKVLQGDIAVLNAGDIRDDGVCGVKLTTLTRGTITRKDVRTVLPFDNALYLVAIKLSDLRKVLEHGYYAAGNRTFPPGSFLQIAGARVKVDCTLPAEKIGNGAVITEGMRVRSIEFCGDTNIADTASFCSTFKSGGNVLAPRDVTGDSWVAASPTDVPPDTIVKLVTSDFVIGDGGNDNFIVLAGVKDKPCPSKTPAAADTPCVLAGTELGADVFNSVVAWMNADSTQGGKLVPIPVPDGQSRIVMSSCP